MTNGTTTVGNAPLTAARFAWLAPRGWQVSSLYSYRGSRWGEFLARTGRRGSARRLTDYNRNLSTDQG